MSKLVVIVDDEPDIVDLVSLHLKKAGFAVEGFLDGKSFLVFIKRRIPDLLVLDLMLPDTDGFEICKQLKGQAELVDLPIVILTARNEEVDKILGLDLGADDYVTKPFSPKELVARVKAVLRRHQRRREGRRIIIDDVMTIDLARYEVTVDGRRAELTPTEFRILSLLSSRRGWVFSRDQILDHLWGREKVVVDRTVDVHIKNLRDKLGQAAGFIQNVRGLGYKLIK